MRFTSSLTALAAWTALTSTTLAAPVAEPALEERQLGTCYSGVYVVSARGTFEPQNASLSDIVGRSIVRNIPGSAFTQITYPGNVDPTSPHQGYSAMKDLVESYGRSCPNSKTVLMGYSQGASVVGLVIANIIPAASVNPIAAKNIVTVVQFGDPSRNIDLGDTSLGESQCKVSAVAARNGDSYNQMAAYKGRHLDFCHEGDPVCCATGNDAYDHIGYYTNERADAIAAFVKTKL